MTLHFKAYDRDGIAQNAPLEYSSTTSNQAYRFAIKRLFDVLITLMAAPVVLPLVAFTALLIALDGHNPFYCQARIGKDGRIFRMCKLRTMVPRAETLLESYLAANPAARLEWDTTQKLKRDPRITKIGKLLRKTSFDELPQFLNVLNGTMSLVGPRPMMVSQRDAYHGTAYFNLRPGITGLWQISDRNESSFLERVRFDDTYDKTVSLKTDLVILIATVGVVFRGTGY